MLSEEMINHEFSRAFKGYDIEQVEEYIEKFIGMYEQLVNENKELTLRYEQLVKALEDNKETVEAAARLSEERERIVEDAKAQGQALISEAETEAQGILLGAKQKAQSTIENAEGMARRLLTEAKSRAESMDAETQNVKKASQAEAESIIADAKEEAKKLIRATKVNCVKRLDECNRELDAAKAEHDAIRKKAADFKAMLFEAYSAHILSIENIEIPEPLLDNEQPQGDAPEEQIDACANLSEAVEPTKAEQTTESTLPEEQETGNTEDNVRFAPVFPLILDVPDAESGEENQSQTDSRPSLFSPPESSAQEDIEANEPLNYDEDDEISLPDKETSYVFDGGSIRTSREGKKDEYKSFTGFKIEKERSGQVQYDSTDITSVNKTLDDIITKKGKGSAQDKTEAYPGKLGFLK